MFLVFVLPGYIVSLLVEMVLDDSFSAGAIVRLTIGGVLL